MAQPEQHDTPAFWDLIDAVLVINMPNRKDRWDELIDSISGFIPQEKIHRIEAIVGIEIPGYLQKPLFTAKTPEHVAKMKAGSAGCCLSHRKALEYARDNRWERTLILEDDAQFLTDFNGPLGHAAATVIGDQTQPWHMFYLGFYQRLQKYYTAATVEENSETYQIMRIRGPVLAHAIVYHRDALAPMLAGLPTIDTVWEWMAYWGSIDSWIYNKFGRSKHITTWGIHPSAVIQKPIYSDIVGRVLTEDEARGIHRKRTLIPYPTLTAFEKTLNLTTWERLYQGYKRTTRLWKAKLFGYKRT